MHPRSRKGGVARSTAARPDSTGLVRPQARVHNGRPGIRSDVRSSIRRSSFAIDDGPLLLGHIITRTMIKIDAMCAALLRTAQSAIQIVSQAAKIDFWHSVGLRQLSNFFGYVLRCRRFPPCCKRVCPV